MIARALITLVELLLPAWPARGGAPPVFEETIQDINRDEQSTLTGRHDGSNAPPLKDRPRRGHIGFQELTRGGTHVQIRGAKICELNSEEELRGAMRQ